MQGRFFIDAEEKQSQRQICSPCGNKVLCLAWMGFASSVWLGLGIDNFSLSLSHSRMYSVGIALELQNLCGQTLY